MLRNVFIRSDFESRIDNNAAVTTERPIVGGGGGSTVLDNFPYDSGLNPKLIL